MTFTEISEIAGLRLSELISSPTLEAVCSCLGISNGGNASQIFAGLLISPDLGLINKSADAFPVNNISNCL